MLKSFYAALNATGPLALELFLGYLLMRIKVLNKQEIATLSKFAFAVLLPFTFFNSMRGANFAADINMGELGMYVVLTFVFVFVGWFYGVKFVKGLNMKAPAMQGVFRTNCVIFALPIAKTLFNPSELANMILYMALVIPILNLLSVVFLAAYGEETSEVKISGRDMLKTIVTSPVILGTVLGMLWNPVQKHIFVFPASINRVFVDLGTMSTILLLITVGANINLENIKNYGKDVIKFTSLSMIIKPLISCMIMIAAGFTGAPLLIGTLIMGTPPPVATVGMAIAQKRDGVFAGLLVSFCSLVSVVTLFAFIFLLGSLGFINYK